MKNLIQNTVFFKLRMFPSRNRNKKIQKCKFKNWIKSKKMYAHTPGFFFPIPGRGGALSIKMPVLMQHQTFCNGHESFVRGRGNFLFFLKIWKCLFFLVSLCVFLLRFFWESMLCFSRLVRFQHGLSMRCSKAGCFCRFFGCRRRAPHPPRRLARRPQSRGKRRGRPRASGGPCQGQRQAEDEEERD